MSIQEIPFETPGSHGEPIRGDLRLPGEGPPRPLLIVAHGFKGFKDWGFFPHLGRSLAGGGIPNVICNASHGGVGEDMENFTRLDLFRKNTWGKELEDLRAVMDAAVRGDLPEKDAYDRDRLRLLGHSRGGGLVLMQAGRDDRVDRVTTIAAISHVDRFSDEVKRRWRENGFITIHNMRTKQDMPMDRVFLEDLEQNREAYSIERAVPSLRAPLLVIHGDGDESVPVAEAHEIASWAGPDLVEKVILPDCDHVLNSAHPFPGTNPTLESAINSIRRHNT